MRGAEQTAHRLFIIKKTIPSSPSINCVVLPLDNGLTMLLPIQHTLRISLQMVLFSIRLGHILTSFLLLSGSVPFLWSPGGASGGSPSPWILLPCPSHDHFRITLMYFKHFLSTCIVLCLKKLLSLLVCVGASLKFTRLVNGQISFP